MLPGNKRPSHCAVAQRLTLLCSPPLSMASASSSSAACRSLPGAFSSYAAPLRPMQAPSSSPPFRTPSLRPCVIALAMLCQHRDTPLARPRSLTEPSPPAVSPMQLNPNGRRQHGHPDRRTTAPSSPGAPAAATTERGNPPPGEERQHPAVAGVTTQALAGFGRKPGTPTVRQAVGQGWRAEAPAIARPFAGRIPAQSPAPRRLDILSGSPRYWQPPTRRIP